jgi:formate hydrogenlyase subunit 3/multisubunit Na+/H+ antiporter MnhD subunit
VPLLIALASIAAALLLLGIFIALLPRQSARATMASAALSGVGALIALAGLLGPGSLGPHGGALLGIPIGLPGIEMLLALDPLAGLFLLLLLTVATACAVFALDGHEPEHRRITAWFPVLVGGTMLALLAADAFTLMFALEATSVVVGLVVLTRQRGRRHRQHRAFLLRHRRVRCVLPDRCLGAAGSADVRRPRSPFRGYAGGAPRGLAQDVLLARGLRRPPGGARRSRSPG